MEELYTQTAIKRKVLNLAERVSDVVTTKAHFHVIMDGSFMFAADFVRVYTGKVSRISFSRVSRGYSEGKIHDPVFVDTVVLQCPLYFSSLDPKETHIVLDVCVEKGKTMAYFVSELRRNVRPDTRIIRVALVGITKDGLDQVDLVGFIQTKGLFLTGYGMGPYRDFAQIYGVPRK